jgi:integrase
VWTELQNDLLDDYDLSNGRVNKIVSAASHAMRFTFNRDLHSYKRPFYELLDEDECRQAYFTKEQVVKLCLIAVDIYNNQNLADAMNVAAYTGIRQGEFLRVRIRDVDQANNVVWIGGRPETTTKSGKGRPVPIHVKIQPIFDKRIQEKNPKGLLFGDEWLNKGQLYKQFVKCRKLSGLDESFVWHSFRHSFCTWSGAVDHPRNIQAIAGHKSVDTTLKYCKATNKALHNLVAKL